MPLFSKLETKALFLDASDPGFPGIVPTLDPYGYQESTITVASPDFNAVFNSYDETNGIAIQYTFNSQNFGAVFTEASVNPAGFFVQDTGGVSGSVNLFMENANGTDYLHRLITFANFIDGSVTTDAPVNADFQLAFTSADADWTFKTSYNFATFGPFAGASLIAVQEYTDFPGTFYVMAAIFDPFNPDGLHNVYNAFTTNFGFFPKANFTIDQGQYLTIGTSDDNANIYMISWQPETFVNWKDGVYSFVTETITFDDAAIQAAIDADLYFIAQQPNRYDRFFIALYEPGFVSGGQVLEVFPLGTDETGFPFGSPVYNVLNFEATSPLAQEMIDNYALDDVAYAESIDAYAVKYLSGGDEIPLYGIGTGSPAPPASLFVPRFTAVRLPCIVNCIPLIDKRK